MRKGEERTMLDALANSPDLSDWESGFVESLSDQLHNGRELTIKQLEKLVQVYERRVLHY